MKMLLQITVWFLLSVITKTLLAATCILSVAPATSAYINAYNQGRIIPPLIGPTVSTLQSRTNFGSDLPLASSSGDCEVTGITNDSSPPEPGYSLVASINRVLPSVTGGNYQIGTVYERVWRNTSGNTCYFGTRVGNLLNVDHDAGSPGLQVFEINDIARGGYSVIENVEVGWVLVPNSNGLPTYRIGRTFTSVQHRAYTYGSGTIQSQRQNNGNGYLDLPSIGGSTTLNINGNSIGHAPGTVAPTASPSQQQAAVNSNWIDFTVLAGGLNNPTTSMNYVKAPCNLTSPSSWVKTGAIRIRQTAREATTFKEIQIDGYAPPNSVVP